MAGFKVAPPYHYPLSSISSQRMNIDLRVLLRKLVRPQLPQVCETNGPNPRGFTSWLVTYRRQATNSFNPVNKLAVPLVYMLQPMSLAAYCLNVLWLRCHV